MEEIWKPVVWYEWLYEVSSLWRVRGIDRFLMKRWFYFHKKWMLMNISNCLIYKNVSLSKNWKPKTFIVSRLVAQAFIPNPENKPYACHKDETLINWSLNNNVNNLFWWTSKDNTNDMINKWRSRLIHKYWEWKKSWLHHSSIKITQYSKDLTLIRTWDSSAEAIRETWVKWIYLCLKWKRKSAWWFIWRYA